MKKARFISLMNDATFKTIWMKGKIKSREFLYRIIKEIVGYDVSSYKLMEYVGRNRMIGILLVSEDGIGKIGIELNNYYKEVSIKRLDNYLNKVAREFYQYDKEKYANLARINQISINDFIDLEVDRNEMLKKVSFNFNRDKVIDAYGVYLPLVIDDEDEFSKDLAMFKTSSYSEMERIARGDECRQAILNELKELGRQEEFWEDYDYEKYLEEIRYAEREEGVSLGRKRIIKTMIRNGMRKEDIEMAIYHKIDE